MAERRSVRVPGRLIVVAMIVAVIPDSGVMELGLAAALFVAGIAHFVWQPTLHRRQARHP